MHEKVRYVREDCKGLNELLGDFSEKYIKDYAVAGFFYSYMMPFQKKKSESDLES